MDDLGFKQLFSKIGDRLYKATCSLSRWRFDAAGALRALPALLVLLVIFYAYSGKYLQANAGQALGFALSLQFLFFAAVGLLLLYGKLSDKIYSAVLFAASFAYFYLFHGHLQHQLTLAGDNLCQIAYWEILFNPNLTGSIGASFTKPGQIVVMGLLHELADFLGEPVFAIGICLVMAFCIWSLARIAADLGGKIAGVIALPVGSAVFLGEFIHGSYSIFLVPVLFTGLRLYFFVPARKTAGRFLLLFSIHFHIQAVALLGAVWGMLLAAKKWRELATFSVLGLFSSALWVVVILRVQGGVERLNSGAAVGYIAPYNGTDGDVVPVGKFEYFLHVSQAGFVDNYYFIIPLALLAAFGVAGCFRYGFKQYLTLFAIMLLLLFNVLVLGGDFNYERYFAPFYAFAVAVGIGMVVRYYREIVSERQVLSVALTSLALFFLSLVFDYSIFHRYAAVKAQMLPFVASSSRFLADKNIPPATRLMAEDDLLYPLVVMQPDRYSKLTALQYFNVVPEAERKAILAETDYIWIAIAARHMYYYLDYLPDPSWASDPFRLMALGMIQDPKPRYLYGFWFVPVDMDYERLILKVEPARYY